MAGSATREGFATTQRVGEPDTLVAPTVAAQDLGIGDTVGRYRLERRLGAGGMGEVFEALDPELDRRVAVKILRAAQPEGAQGLGPDARLLREARGMARLSHPNVVPVYDVGRSHNRLFIAMELVEGETMSHWLSGQGRKWTRIVDVFAAAARGLQAAHDAGLVHRDFKPANVMITPKDSARPHRVQVLDFGLARGAGEPALDHGTAGHASDDDDDDDDATHDAPVTSHGTVLGTPLYMAPEQHEGRELDPRTDQYAFCIALYAALYGERPFVGRFDDLAQQKIDGVPPPHDMRGVPGHVWRAIQRGLAADPDDRFDSMSDLVAALRRRRSTRAIGVAAFGAVLLGGAGWWTWPSSDPATATECSNLRAKIDGIWNAERGRAARSAATDAEHSYARALAERSIVRLDRYADAWVAASTDACRAESTHTDTESAQRRRACLSRRRVDLRNAARIVANMSDASAQGITKTIDRLPDPADCNESHGLHALLPMPDDMARRKQVETLRDEMSEGVALADAGQHQEALALYDAIVDRSRTTAFEPLFAELDFHRANALRLAGDTAAGNESFERAYVAATTSGHDRIATQSAAMLVQQIALAGSDPNEVQRWIRNAEASLARLDDAPLLEASVEFAKAVAASSRDDTEALFVHAQRALELRQRALGPDHPTCVATRTYLADAEATRGNHTAAVVAYEQAKRSTVTTWGPGHPDVAALESSLGSSKAALGDLDAARLHLEAALQLRRKTLPASHIDVLSTKAKLARLLGSLGQLDEALALMRPAVQGISRELGPNHLEVGRWRSNVGELLRQAGRFDEAETETKGALEVFETAATQGHPEVARIRSSLGQILMAQGRVEEAEPMLAQSVQESTAVLGVDNPVTAALTIPWAEALVERGQAGRAQDVLSTTIPVLAETATDSRLLVAGRLTLARAHWALGHRDEARALAERVRAALTRDAAGDLGSLKKLDDWLESVGEPVPASVAPP